MIYRTRLIEKKIKELLESIGGIVIQGARGVGKTETSKIFAKSKIRLDESINIKTLANIDPNKILIGDTPRLIDEWQLAEPIWNAVRHEIDERQLPGQFILSGSASPTDDITRHTGSMRIGKVYMKTMSLMESGNSNCQVNFVDLFVKNKNISGKSDHKFDDYLDLIVKGGWPILLNASPTNAMQVIKNYVDNLCSVDLKTLDSKPNKVRMKSLLKSLSRNIGTNASLITLSKDSDIKIERHTIRRYIDQLMQIFIVEELLPWKTHVRSSVQSKQGPKWYFVDPSIPVAILNLSPGKLIDDIKALGFYFESLALRDIKIYAEYMGGEVYYFNDSKGLDIDAIVELPNGEWSAFEIKLGGQDLIDLAINSLKALTSKVKKHKLDKLISLNVITAGNVSYTDKKNKINIIALGHLFVK